MWTNNKTFMNDYTSILFLRLLILKVEMVEWLARHWAPGPYEKNPYNGLGQN